MSIITDATVIEHLAEPAIGHGIMGSAREFVEHLLVIEHQHAEVVILLVQASHAIGLLEVSTRSEDNHIGGSLAVDILVFHLTDQFGM